MGGSIWPADPSGSSTGFPEALDGFYLCAFISRPQNENDEGAYLTGFLWNKSINN